MKKPTAAQQRFFDNATLIAATRLIFDKLAKHHKPEKLSDVVTIFNGQSLKKSERQDDGIFDVYGSGGLVGNYSESLSDNPFVVIGRKGSAGKPTYAPSGGWVIDTAYYAQPNDSDALNTKFLYYAISSLNFSDDIISTAIPGINRTAIYKHPIPIPPIDIQIAVSNFLDATKSKTTLPALPNELADIHRIVARIEALAALVAEAQSLRREADVETDAFYHSALAAAIPWNTYTIPLLETIEEDTKISYGVLVPGSDVDDGVPFVRIQDLDLHNPSSKPNKRIAPEISAQYKRTLLQGGEILIAVVGATIGKIGISPKEWKGANIARAVCRIVPSKAVDTKYLAYVLQSSPSQNYFRDASRTQAQPTLNVRQLEQTPIPVPPLEEQRRLVAYLDGLQAQVSALRAAQAETEKELSALMPSILDKAFKGEL